MELKFMPAIANNYVTFCGQLMTLTGSRLKEGEIVPEITSEPDYDKALSVLRSLPEM